MGIAQWFEKPGTAAVDTKGVRTYTRKFLFVMEFFTDYPPVVWATGGPSIVRYQAHPNDTQALAISMTVNSTDVVGHYEIDVSYSSQPFETSAGNTANDLSGNDQSTTPTSRPWVIKFASIHTERLLGPLDLNGQDVVNAAGQPFDPPPTIPCSNLQINITAYKDSTWDAATHILDYQDTINASDFNLVINPSNTMLFPKQTLRVTEYNASSVNENGIWYWEISLVIEYRVKPWNPIKVLNAGMCYVKDSSTPPQKITDNTGNDVSRPVPLDSAGHVLNAGAALNYIDFKGYDEQNFNLILS